MLQGLLDDLVGRSRMAFGAASFLVDEFMRDVSHGDGMGDTLLVYIL